MIQRIQSVYLFIAAALMVAMPFLPVMQEISSNELNIRAIGLFSLGSYSVLPGITLPALAVFTGILTLINIFLYKKRKIQVKICCWILVLILLMYGLTFYAYAMLSEAMNENMIIFPEIAMAFPLISLLLDGMAILGIKKDERIVSSLGRIR